MSRKPTIRLGDLAPGLNPHEGQLKVLSDPARFKIVVAGRRWGKTQLAAQECALRVLSLPPKSILWFVSPSYPQQEEAWEKVLLLYLPARHPTFKTARNPDGKFVTNVYSSRGFRHLEFYNGSKLYFKSGRDPDSLRGGGERLVYVVFDEAAYLSDYAWDVVRISLMDRLGHALFISTPNAHDPLNWFYDLFLIGLETLDADCPECNGLGCQACQMKGTVQIPNPHRKNGYKSFHFTSYDNPTLAREEIDAILAEGKSYDFIQREIYAQFVESTGAVFTMETINACEKGEFLPPQKGKKYAMGVDFGQVRDYTVVVVINLETNHVDALERFQGTWDYQFERIMKIYFDYFEPITYVDANQVQGSIIEQELRKRGMVHMVGVKINAESKRRLIEALRVAIERAELTFPPHRQLRSELLAYTVKKLPSGFTRYTAPQGGFDDCVDALALAWEAARSQQRVSGWRPKFWVLGEKKT